MSNSKRHLGVVLIKYHKTLFYFTVLYLGSLSIIIIVIARYNISKQLSFLRSRIEVVATPLYIESALNRLFYCTNVYCYYKI